MVLKPISCKQAIDIGRFAPNHAYLSFSCLYDGSSPFKADGVELLPPDDLKITVNLFSSTYMGIDHKADKEMLAEEGIVGIATFHPKDKYSTNTVFLEIYLDADVYKEITQQCLHSLPECFTLAMEESDGGYFLGDWVKGEDGKYPKIKITEFSYYNKFH